MQIYIKDFCRIFCYQPFLSSAKSDSEYNPAKCTFLPDPDLNKFFSFEFTLVFNYFLKAKSKRG